MALAWSLRYCREWPDRRAGRAVTRISSRCDVLAAAAGPLADRPAGGDWTPRPRSASSDGGARTRSATPRSSPPIAGSTRRRAAGERRARAPRGPEHRAPAQEPRCPTPRAWSRIRRQRGRVRRGARTRRRAHGARDRRHVGRRTGTSRPQRHGGARQRPRSPASTRPGASTCERRRVSGCRRLGLDAIEAVAVVLARERSKAVARHVRRPPSPGRRRSCRPPCGSGPRARSPGR